MDDLRPFKNENKKPLPTGVWMTLSFIPILNLYWNWKVSQLIKEMEERRLKNVSEKNTKSV